MPGLSLHDLGDLVRSMCNSSVEDESDLSKVNVRMEMFEAIVKGFLSGAGSMLNADEIKLMPYAGITMTTETGVRFLTDYLSGDVYFRIKHPEHNIVRARAQLTLATKMVEAIPAMNAIVSKISNFK